MAMLPPNVKALILLFPCSDNYEAHRKEEDEKLKKNPAKVPDDLFYMKQVTEKSLSTAGKSYENDFTSSFQIVHNACGTIALAHALLNNLKSITLEDGSVLKNFLEKAKELSPEERGKLLEGDSAFTESHQELAQEGQTATPGAEGSFSKFKHLFSSASSCILFKLINHYIQLLYLDKVNHHFIALVNVNGELFELDGRKNFPVKHGDTTEDKFLTDAAAVCKQFMARDPNELRFTILAVSTE